MKQPKSGKGVKAQDVLFYLSGIICAIIIVVVDFFVISKLSPVISQITYIFAAVAAFSPVMIKFYGKFNRKRQIESGFPIFLRDFIESVRSGMTLPQAFKSVSANDYGVLTTYIRKMSAQMNWGIPIEQVLLNFSKEIQSPLIGRIISTVIESHSFGGNLTETFEALSRTTAEVEKLRRERYVYLQSQVVTGYIVFFVFLAVIIGLNQFLTPSLSSIPVGGLGGLGQQIPPAELAKQYNSMYKNLVLIQGLFAGLAIGKMSQSSMIAGVKHSLIMILTGYITLTLFGSPAA